MFTEGRIVSATSTTPTQAGLLRYTVTAIDGPNRVSLKDVLPLKRPVKPNDANDPAAFPNIIPAVAGEVCVMIRLNGRIALWETTEAAGYGPCVTQGGGP